MKRPKRILFIASAYPFPPDDGHKLRNYYLFRNLSEGYQFELLSFADQDDIEDKTKLVERMGPQCTNVTTVHSDTLIPLKREHKHLIGKIKNIFYPDEVSIGLPLYSQEMKTMVKEKIKTGNYDVIFFCGISMYMYRPDNINDYRYIVDMVDSASLLTKSYLDSETHFTKKFRRLLDYIWANRYEKLHVSRVKNLILISPVDREQVEKNTGNRHIEVLPNGVETQYFSDSSGVSKIRNCMLFTGVMDYTPNNDAMVYFINEVLPLVKAKIPDVTLIIAGKNPTQELQALASQYPEITLTGFVDDIRPYFQKSMIYVAPIISGAGVKNKILEAWSMSLPVVSTSAGCFGIEARHGENVLLVDDASSFASEIVRLLSDKELQSKLGTNGRKTVETSYSWKSRARKMQEIIDSVIEA